MLEVQDYTLIYFLKNYHLPEIAPNLEFRNKLKQLESEELFEILKNKDLKASESIDKNDRKKNNQSTGNHRNNRKHP